MDENDVWSCDVDALPKAETFPIPESPESQAIRKSRVNPGEPPLPQTGQLNWPIPLLFCCGAVLILVGILLRRRKREA